MCFFKMRTLLILTFLGLQLAFGATAAENTASIAVAADGSGPEAAVSEKAGRAAYFLFFDGNGNFLAAEKNSFSCLPGGAGSKAAVFLSGKGVALVIAGDFGSKMKRALSSNKIKFILQAGVAHEVVKAVIKEQ